MESLNQKLDTFGMAGIIDSTAMWSPHVMDNVTQNTIVDAELSRYVDLSKAYFWNVSIKLLSSDVSPRPYPLLRLSELSKSLKDLLIHTMYS